RRAHNPKVVGSNPAPATISLEVFKGLPFLMPFGLQIFVLYLNVQFDYNRQNIYKFYRWIYLSNQQSILGLVK
ncbi:MAG: hypothetical protein ACLSWI_02820, partial [Candidatus Gastranaerophilaceae bacterium]